MGTSTILTFTLDSCRGHDDMPICFLLLKRHVCYYFVFILSIIMCVFFPSFEHNFSDFLVSRLQRMKDGKRDSPAAAWEGQQMPDVPPPRSHSLLNCRKKTKEWEEVTQLSDLFSAINQGHKYEIKWKIGMGWGAFNKQNSVTESNLPTSTSKIVCN